MKKLKQIVVGLVTLIVLVVIMLAGLLAQITALITLPFTDKLAYLINGWVAYFILSAFQYKLENFSDITFEIVGDIDTIPSGESAILISNHRSMVDWAIIHHIAKKKSMLAYQRYFVKDSLKYIPIVGIVMKLMGMIFLKRDWGSDEHKLYGVFSYYLNNSFKVWAMLFPEGHRLTKEKLAESNKYAQLTGKEELHNVLYPRRRGFQSSIQGLRGSGIKYLYDLTIVFYKRYIGVDYVPSFGKTVLGNSEGTVFHGKITKYLIDELPKEEHELAAWLENQFRAKDQYIEDLRLTIATKYNSQ